MSSHVRSLQLCRDGTADEQTEAQRNPSLDQGHKADI